MTIPFTLHVRLTKACNANCTYCSSFMENPDKYMSPDDYLKSLKFTWNMLDELGLKISDLTIEYVGGEIMLVPMDKLEEIVNKGREFFKEKGVSLNDGAQTNLIGSKKRVAELDRIFNSKISTSIDSFTNQRRVGDSAKKYRVIMMQREEELTEDSVAKIPAVFTMDQKSISHTIDEFKLANRANRNLMIRPVFNGGSSIDSISPSQLSEVMEDTFDQWFMRSRVILEPHFSLLKKRLQTVKNHDPLFNHSYCSFQNDCAKKSLSLEPNGDLYICQEMADAGAKKIGNALKEEFDYNTWKSYSERENNLHSDCISCPYFKDCQGGCMLHAMQSDNGIYGKPSYCESWKAIFRKIDNGINSTDTERLLSWINMIE